MNIHLSNCKKFLVPISLSWALGLKFTFCRGRLEERLASAESQQEASQEAQNQAMQQVISLHQQQLKQVCLPAITPPLAPVHDCELPLFLLFLLYFGSAKYIRVEDSCIPLGICVTTHIYGAHGGFQDVK